MGQGSAVGRLAQGFTPAGVTGASPWPALGHALHRAVAGIAARTIRPRRLGYDPGLRRGRRATAASSGVRDWGCAALAIAMPVQRQRHHRRFTHQTLGPCMIPFIDPESQSTDAPTAIHDPRPLKHQPGIAPRLQADNGLVPLRPKGALQAPAFCVDAAISISRSLRLASTPGCSVD